jgi:hypothetical protein
MSFIANGDQVSSIVACNSHCHHSRYKSDLFRTTTELTQRSILACRLRLNCDSTRAETRFRLSAKRTSIFKSARASIQSNTGSRGVRISGSNVGYTMFQGSVKSTGYPLHSPVSHSLPLQWGTVCHHISAGLYYRYRHSARHVRCSAVFCIKMDVCKMSATVTNKT